MLDMTVGVIVGGAFTAIVTSIVTNIATPLISILIGVDFKEWVIELPRLYGTAAPGTMSIGLFINSIINFIVVAITLFLVVKAFNKIRRKQDTAPQNPPEPTTEERLLTEIRDILKEKANAKINMPETEAAQSRIFEQGTDNEQ